MRRGYLWPFLKTCRLHFIIFGGGDVGVRQGFELMVWAKAIICFLVLIQICVHQQATMWINRHPFSERHRPWCSILALSSSVASFITHIILEHMEAIESFQHPIYSQFTSTGQAIWEYEGCCAAWTLTTPDVTYSNTTQHNPEASAQLADEIRIPAVQQLF